ncbi:malate dehydrogenase [Almyronema epifaneia]|uniref:Malate dehydrogenase n=1 Tax=Almyronema epifaneia S1 TaxID=2991925 RepID=A0ABW6IFQ7_9CYAN
MDLASAYRSRRVAIVGAGNVGSTLAQRIAEKNLADVVLLDVVEGRPQGLALDLLEASGLVGHHRQIIGTNDYADTADSDIVVITAGLPRKPGMSRDDLLQVNGKIVLEVARQAIAYSPQARFVVVTNPLDVMVYLVWKATGLPSQQVMGMAGVLDSARFQTFISLELKVPPQDVSAMVLGGHGDLMVPLPQYSTVCGIPIPELLDQATVERLCDRTRHGGAEIVGLLQRGGAYSAPSAAIYKMVEAILLNQSRILPASAYLEGQYGLQDLYLGVPCRVGWPGVEEILELRLTDAEHDLLQRSGDFVKVRTEQVLQQLM